MTVNGFDSFLLFCRDDYDGRAEAKLQASLCIHGAPIHFLASLFMLSLIKTVFD